ncbi:group II intron reverse transcriptase/maturase [Clostridium botulinum]|uniref:Group II intron reverse transcriptase/maturase n=1 Tax=Clostridium botulinum TaxID=1491 RepID=A0A6M0V510_CLOBO|nr:group II intron reverse transcriptase/maturase [Clostridium botulinum]NFE61344.1 group II intron reverse transcriptase/maturase [Clostridium botulinum]NFF87818.1 group II intron reverse transcriptase/maturase [Clostridium botulinum]NFG11676.1 group II intron reverse transcriptase/maturase [Clostridium botulinum]
MTANKHRKKKQKIRNNEYYNTQEIMDDLYFKSKENHKFTKLLELITSEQNILLAYRNIKKNKGSKTCGTNKNNIMSIAKQNPEKLIKYVRYRLSNFKPHSIKRKEIEKSNGKMRPLGIPTIEDRLIQQCIKQIIEPICEAKFYKHSYGFRPNRSAHHAIARALYLTNLKNFQYVVDVDIKGFFDNVNHSKLLKQIWNLGIQDKRLICIISKMLKAEVKGIGISQKGVPQGGILSPILSNIVLNEFDWWIASQWEAYKTNYKYSNDCNRYAAQKRTNLKEIYIVRYADDFKIFCKNRSTANKIFTATKDWLDKRLDLEISPEKSKIINLKKQYSEFLGIKMKLRRKGNKNTIKSYMTDKAIKKCKTTLKEKVKIITRTQTAENAISFNSTILGMHNYYNVATHISFNFRNIAYEVEKNLKSRLKMQKKKVGNKSKAFIEYYGGYTGKVRYIQSIALFPLSYIRTKPPMCFSQEICNYTKIGRIKIHDRLKYIDIRIIRYLMNNYNNNMSIEYNDNRISLYVAQQGRCAITKEKLEINNIKIHHRLAIENGGNDKYNNLILVTTNVYKLISATTPEDIEKYLKRCEAVKINLKLLNQLRELVGNSKILVNK